MEDWLADLPAESRAQWFSPAGLASVIAALGVAGFVWFRLATDIFYGTLGARPEELGVSYPGVLVQSVYGGFFGVVLWGTFLSVSGCLAALGRKLWEGGGGAGQRRMLSRILGGALLVLLGVLGVLGGQLISQAVILSLVFAGLIVSLRATFRVSSRRRALAAVVAGLVVLPLVVLPPLVAIQDANSVRRGEPSLFRVFGAALFPWAPDTAVVHWKSKSGAPPSLRRTLFACVFYLGQSPAGAVVYATNADGGRQLLRVPAADAVIEVVPDANGCTTWPNAKGQALL
jgi:hypothetical protein